MQKLIKKRVNQGRNLTNAKEVRKDDECCGTKKMLIQRIKPLKIENQQLTIVNDCLKSEKIELSELRSLWKYTQKGNIILKAENALLKYIYIQSSE